MPRSQNLLDGFDKGWCQLACRGHKRKNTLTAFLRIDPWRTVMFKGGVTGTLVSHRGPGHNYSTPPPPPVTPEHQDIRTSVTVTQLHQDTGTPPSNSLPLEPSLPPTGLPRQPPPPPPETT